MIENWKDIKGFEGTYQVSDQGNVRSLDRKMIYSNGKTHFYKGKMLKSYTEKSGYVGIKLFNHCSRKTTRIHRLVMETFVPVDDPTSLEVNHIDFNRANNTLSNLEWVTHAKNIQHSVLGGRFDEKHKNKSAADIDDYIVHLDQYQKQGRKIPIAAYDEDMKLIDVFESKTSRLIQVKNEQNIDLDLDTLRWHLNICIKKGRLFYGYFYKQVA